MKQEDNTFQAKGLISGAMQDCCNQQSIPPLTLRQNLNKRIDFHLNRVEELRKSIAYIDRSPGLVESLQELKMHLGEESFFIL